PLAGRHLAPARPGDQRVALGAEAEPQVPGPGVVPGAGPGINDREAGHRPRVVIAALDLVVGVAPAAIVAVPQPGQDPQALLGHPLEQAVRGDLVLDPGPYLVGVADRHGRAGAARPGADQQAG